MDARIEQDIIALAGNCDETSLARVGFWRKEKDEKAGYVDALIALRGKLTRLISPERYAIYLKGKPEPEVMQSEGFIRTMRGLTPDFLAHRMIAGKWRFPRYAGKDVSVADWKTCINELIAPQDLDELEPQIVIRTEEDNQAAWTIHLPFDDMVAYSRDWFADVTRAQQIQSWAGYYLVGEQALLMRLHSLAKECSRIMHGGLGPIRRIQDLAQELSPFLKDFIEVLVLVIRWQDFESGAQEMLSTMLDGPKNVLSQVERVLGKADGLREAQVVVSELGERLNAETDETWLSALVNAAALAAPDLFEAEVLMGVRGLNRQGLGALLKLKPGADVDEFREELRQPGKYVSGDRTLRAVWWQDADPPGSKEGGYRLGYRMLPGLDRGLTDELGQVDRAADLKYIHGAAGTEALDLIIAIDFACIAPLGDHTTSASYLMRPFAALVKEKLADPKGILEIVSSGVGGDPLFAPALREAGLTKAELKRLAKYYTLTDL